MLGYFTDIVGKSKCDLGMLTFLYQNPFPTFPTAGYAIGKLILWNFIK